MRRCPNRQPENPGTTHKQKPLSGCLKAVLAFKTDLQHRQRGFVIRFVGNFRHQLDMQHFVLFV